MSQPSSQEKPEEMHFGKDVHFRHSEPQLAREILVRLKTISGVIGRHLKICDSCSD
jgi:hypothetical protein